MVLKGRVEFGHSVIKGKDIPRQNEQRVRGREFAVCMKNDLSSKIKYAIKYYTLELVIIKKKKFKCYVKRCIA